MEKNLTVMLMPSVRKIKSLSLGCVMARLIPFTSCITDVRATSRKSVEKSMFLLVIGSCKYFVNGMMGKLQEETVDLRQMLACTTVHFPYRIHTL